MSKLPYLILAILLVAAPVTFAAEAGQSKPKADSGCAVTTTDSKAEVEVLTEEEIAALLTSWKSEDGKKEIQLSANVRPKPKSFQLTANLSQRKPKYARITKGDASIYVLDSDNKKILQAKISLAKLVPC